MHSRDCEVKPSLVFSNLRAGVQHDGSAGRAFVKAEGLLLGAEGPVTTPSGIAFSFFFFSSKQYFMSRMSKAMAKT